MKKIFTLLTVLGLSVMGLKAQQVWTGATSTDWNDATNWREGAVPPDTGRIQISTSFVTVDPITLLPVVDPVTLLPLDPLPVTRFPVLSANTSVDNLTIDAGATLNLNGKTLNVFGRVSGTGLIVGSPTSGIYAGGPGAVIYKLAAEHTLEFSANPARYFEDFSTLENPASPGYGTIEFGDATATFDVSASTSVGEPIIYNDILDPAINFLTVGDASNGVKLVLDMIGTEDITAFSGLFGFTDLGFAEINGHRRFNLVIKFKDGSPDVIRRDSTSLVGAPTFIGVVANRAISQISMEPLENNVYAKMSDLTFGKRVAFGPLNADTLGSLTVDLYHADTLTLADTVNIAQVVTPMRGTILADSKIKLMSSLAGTARVASHNDSSNVAGNVIVERYIPSSRKQQWRFLGFPLSDSAAISDLTGFNYDFTLPTLKYFNPAGDDLVYGTGNAAANAGYVHYTDATQKVGPGQGIAAWLYTSATPENGTLANAITISSTGLLNESGASFTKTLQLGTAGWNLVGNPFASTIDWNSAGITKTNLDATVYRWNPETVNWSTYNSTTGVSTGNGTRYIESGAAFFVKSGASRVITPALTFAQSAKSAEAGTADHLSRNGKRLDIASQRVGSDASSQLSGLRVRTSGTGNTVPADIYLDLSKSDATAAFDSKYDALSMGRSAGADVKFAGEQDEMAVQFDAPIKTPGAEKRYYPLNLSVPQQGAASIDVAVEGSWNSLNTVSLIDTKDNKTIPMVGGKLSYAFKMQDLKEPGRFLLAINHVASKGADNSKEVTVRVLNNPVRSETIQALISHPSAKAKNWSVLSASGSAMSNGQINPADASVQHELKAGKLNSNGVYYLKVNFENGDSKTVRFVKL
jgi:hypothetical protein